MSYRKALVFTALLAGCCLLLAPHATLAEAQAPILLPLSGAQCAPAVDTAPSRLPTAQAPLPEFLTSGPEPVDPGSGIECLSGWCSSNTQCVTWYGQGCICRKQTGATCGQCVCAL